MLGPRLKRAREIAQRRADRLASSEPTITTLERSRVHPPSQDEPHRDPRRAEVGHLTKWNGSCGCSACKDAKRRRYKGASKRERREGFMTEEDGSAWPEADREDVP